MNYLQPILNKPASLSQSLNDRLVLVYRQPLDLNQLLTMKHLWERWELSLVTNPDASSVPTSTLARQLETPKMSHTTSGTYLLFSSANVTYAIPCQLCRGPSALYTEQTQQSLCKKIKGHKSDVRNGNTWKSVLEHFSLSGLSLSCLLYTSPSPRD